ncbi:hypothetical protein [Actinomadura rupiterrae]|uniref:hypothetical protein n=1 Tax=Actinomadura rupiterrae TaxID=559627 RepID=UPI0020A4C1A0|nr:hypothetical protein [Actinomadura rupiterrae]MCP2337647.1 hypothetical protein [Actinomadura rupiterrae]
MFIGIGLSGVVAHSRPGGWAVWVGGGVVAHDALLTPAVLVAGTLLRRWRRLRFGMFVAGVLALVALPMVLGYGRHPDNPSILPSNYLLNLVVAVALVMGAVAVPWRWVGRVLGSGFRRAAGRSGGDRKGRG